MALRYFLLGLSEGKSLQDKTKYTFCTLDNLKRTVIAEINRIPLDSCWTGQREDSPEDWTNTLELMDYTSLIFRKSNTK